MKPETIHRYISDRNFPRLFIILEPSSPDNHHYREVHRLGKDGFPSNQYQTCFVCFTGNHVMVRVCCQLNTSRNHLPHEALG